MSKNETKSHWFHIIQQKDPGDSQKGEGSIHRSEKKPGTVLDYRIKMCLATQVAASQGHHNDEEAMKSSVFFV